jgi:hypothetical protein
VQILADNCSKLGLDLKEVLSRVYLAVGVVACDFELHGDISLRLEWPEIITGQVNSVFNMMWGK